MSRTNNLKKLVKSILSEKNFIEEYGIKEVYFEQASDDAMFPHIVFAFDAVGTGDLNRHDLLLVVDVYAKGCSTELIEDTCDEIEDMFDAANLPQDTILPTFFLESRRRVLDNDKSIRHRQIEILVQNYEEE